MKAAMPPTTPPQSPDPPAAPAKHACPPSVDELKEQVRRLQQLAAVGTTAATIAHEINNLLTPILGYANFAIEHDDAELRKKALNMTVEQIERVIQMTRRTLGNAIDQPHEIKPVRLAEVINEAVQSLCRDLSKDGITLRSNVPGELTIQADPHRMQQVFFNLLINARDALKGRRGRITIQAARKGEFVVITFQDTGCGIEDDLIERVFDAFVSTKRGASGGTGAGTGTATATGTGAGTSAATGEKSDSRSRHAGAGLGLAVCKEIVESYGGRIAVESQPGKQTTFTIRMPAGS